jgi:hypothetical protein
MKRRTIVVEGRPQRLYWASRSVAISLQYLDAPSKLVGKKAIYTL